MIAGVPGPEAVAALPMVGLADWLDGHSARMVDDLAALVRIESPSGDLAALDACLGAIMNWLEGLLGPADTAERHSDAEFGTVVVLDYAATGGAGFVSDTRPVVLLAHYDTVWGVGTLADRPWRESRGRAQAPGGFDMKGGLVQAVWGLAAARRLGIALPTVRIVLTPDEEIGSPFSRPWIERACASARAVLVAESAANGALKTARSGVGLFRVQIDGIASHSGLEPEAGASAIDEAARVVLELHAASNPDARTSVNAGIISGGTRPNVVAAHAVLDVDVRVTSAAEAARIDAVFESLVPRDPRARIAVSGGWNRPVMERTASVAAMFALAAALGERLGEHLEEVAVGGASDGNFAAALGLPVLDGLGAVGGGAHSADEWVDLSAMPVRAALLAGIVATFATPAGSDTEMKYG
ncbi:M20 family metallopeptidase [Compostimonas suwonensis]|uniref:Glutamate carboxypeptidase n=1 Tax=Compostimonas suwonensis TaxID=1048394 RepID=A0A2M9C3N5_9MICO|nr:M20 family metallopeptidase [Compostimonas suwonensis]PJJ65099.1 glutamate carboxypeptidase [Compostimonas suwonensis]